MDRNVTAVYRTYKVADLVRRELEGFGVSRGNIHVIPNTEDRLETGRYREDRRWMDDLHDLHLPEDDLRTYQQCVRRGDYVVSANVDKDSVRRVQEIMRRPEAEAYNLDPRSDEFRDEVVIVHSDPSRAATEPRFVGRPDTEHPDPYVRSYKRDAPLSTSR